VVVWVLAVVCVYVLSVGPVAKLNQGRLVRGEVKAVVKFYTPLMWVVSRSPVLGAALDWYLIKVWRM